MTTQSDREKAEAAALKSPYCNNINGPTYTQACDAYRDGYLAGAEAKDLEWQAKVQGLADALEDIIHREYDGETAGTEVAGIAIEALKKFTSGQPAKGVMVSSHKGQAQVVAYVIHPKHGRREIGRMYCLTEDLANGKLQSFTASCARALVKEIGLSEVPYETNVGQWFEIKRKVSAFLKSMGVS